MVTPVCNPKSGRLRQEECHELKASLGYIESSGVVSQGHITRPYPKEKKRGRKRRQLRVEVLRHHEEDLAGTELPLP